MRRLVNPRRQIAEEQGSKQIYRGTLAEDYDGIGQYILVSLAGSSVAGAYRARLAAGDFGTGQVIPRGTLVSVHVNHGIIEILSMGGK